MGLSSVIKCPPKHFQIKFRDVLPLSASLRERSVAKTELMTAKDDDDERCVIYSKGMTGSVFSPDETGTMFSGAIICRLL